MSSLDANTAPVADSHLGEQDLGPLAWVLDELRKSLEGAVKAMRRFVRDAEAAHESDLAVLDAGSLRIARQQLHQACGALEMVGMASPALVLRAMELAVQKLVQRPEACTDEATAVIERASFALIDYLQVVVAGKSVSPVALFPQYRAVQALAGADRVHPADLWPVERRLREPKSAVEAEPLSYGAEARARLDSAVLRIVKTGDLEAALRLRDTCLRLAAGQADRQARTFWKICAGFFEAFGSGLLPQDVYVKRVASRVLLQYATLAKGDPDIADRLVQDLIFFCSQGQVAELPEDALPSLQAVRQVFALDRFKPVDYETVSFGRFDPAVLAQARKRIAAATETWSALAGGDRNKLKPAADQFSLVCDSIRKLHPGSENLAAALARAVDSTTRSGEPPSAALAMEVATSVLYLQAAFEELDASDDQISVRAVRLAERLDAVGAGADSEPLEQWMEELYRRVSDNQTMGSVVDELRVTLGEVEKSLDQFFRNPTDISVLNAVPGRLAQMRGVLSVLGLDQASLAVSRMRDTVERLLINEVPESERPSTFEKLGNSLGALGFLIDMLSYQRSMARKLFVYDEALGELRIVMGKARARAADAVEEAPVKLEARSDTVVPEVLPRMPVQELPSEPTDFAPLFDFDSTPTPDEPTRFDTFTLDAGIEFNGPSTGPSESLAIPELPSEPVTGPQGSALTPEVPLAHSTDAEIDDELLGVFIEEANEVVAGGLEATDLLGNEPGNLSEQTTLRRAFHTLKGSSRMVGLHEFGEAAWAMEQVINVWLAEQKPMQPDLLRLSSQTLQAFGQWAQDIGKGNSHTWSPEPFIKSAEAMQANGTFVPLATGQANDALVVVDTSDAKEATESPAVASEFAEGADTEFPLAGQDSPATAERQESEGDDDVLALPADAILSSIAEEIDMSVFEAALNGSAPDALDTPDAPVTAIESSNDNVVVNTAFVEPSLETVALLADVDAEIKTGLPAEAADEPQVEMPAEESTPSADLEGAEGAAEINEVEGLEFPGATEPDTPLDEEKFSLGTQPASSELAPELPFDMPSIGVQDDRADDEAVRVIGSLRIGIPLYNVYLNEADEWSRRLVTCLQEWSLELNESLPDTAVALAHSMAGSSATVGFSALSNLARALEHALEHVQLQSGGTAEQAQVFLAAADEVRRLLHQFAAGFLKEANQEVLDQLRLILEEEVSNTLSPLGADFAQLTDASQSVSADTVAQAQTDAIEADDPAVAPAGYVAPALSSVPYYPESSDESVDPAIALASGLGLGIEDDIDAIDVIDPDLFPIFEEEAAELLPQLGKALRQWSVRPDHLGARNEALRALHTLKGSARLAGAMRLGEIAHRLESAIEQLGSDAVTARQIDSLQVWFDALQTNFDALCAVGQSSPDAVVALPVDSAVEFAERAAARSAPSVPAADLFSAAAALTAPTAQAASSAPVAPATRRPAQTPLAPLHAATNQSVRVRSQLLDRLVNQAGEVLISRSRLDARVGQVRTSLSDLTTNLDRLRQHLRDIEVQSESQMQSRLALAKDSAAGFDPLEFDRFTRVQELTRMMAESVNDVATVQRNLQRAMEGAEDDLISQGRQARELQRDLLRTRMVEFEGISERLYAVVRQASKETGKQIKLDITGGSIEMDRGVLDRMIPAFEHLLRNCVAHGIESPQTRVELGKPATGTITVDLRQEGNDVSVEFRDDGAGLNLQRIRDKAVSQGIVSPDAELSDTQAAGLIFTPGFTTATEVTGLAGRGIGMDVVRSEINALGGRIETTTEAGQGAAFRMVLPLTTAVTQVVMLRAGDLAFGVPANVVEIVRRTSSADLQEAYRTGSFDDGIAKIPFFWAGALLQAAGGSGELAGKTRPVVIFRSAAQRMALHVDEVLGNQEVVVKNLGPQLARLPGLAGMSVLASGAVVLIYNPVALATVYGDQIRALSADMRHLLLGDSAASGGSKAIASPQLVGPGQVPLVLVVDDSITVRRVTQRLLQREGYRVALAADGLQALERLQDERPTVVLSDIEMPRMDGFDLARNIRADRELHDLPIIMITSRIAQKHREHAMELGVNHYLGKPYADEELLSLVRHYAQLAAAVEEAH